MAQGIVDAIGGFSADMQQVAVAAVGIGAAALLVWVGWRLVCKLTNRGAGK